MCVPPRCVARSPLGLVGVGERDWLGTLGIGIALALSLLQPSSRDSLDLYWCCLDKASYRSSVPLLVPGSEGGSRVEPRWRAQGNIGECRFVIVPMAEDSCVHGEMADKGSGQILVTVLLSIKNACYANRKEAGTLMWLWRIASPSSL